MKFAFLALAVLAFSCAPPFREPNVEEREAVGMGQPPHRTLPQYAPDGGELSVPDAGCCAVRFAIPAGSEVAVDLFGFGEPLTPEGVALAKDGGVWEATLCLGSVSMLYGYRLYSLPDVGDAGLFPQLSYNPNAPAVMSAQYGLLNEFDSRDAGTCAEVDSAPHADINRPDAGEPVYPDAGEDDAGSASDGG